MQDKFTHKGYEFSASFDYEECPDYPWQNSDCHGPVRASSGRHADESGDKRAGERPLNQASRRETQFYYDWSAACKLARKEWGAKDVEKAVQADFDFLSAYLRDQWHYVAVTVKMLRTGEEECVGMVETYKNGHEEYARELAGQLIHSYRRDLAKRANEKRERTYWASRDVATI